jgi:2,3-bisphosphoglycerate-dependent phosphoglycerate mutase
MTQEAMPKLFLLRHLKSQWNLEDRFAGWVDNPLSKEANEAIKPIAESMATEQFDIIYTSPLIRCKQTVLKLLKNLNAGEKYPLFVTIDGGRMQRWGNFVNTNKNSVSSFVSEKLNERYYGRLQGLNKKETAEKYGEEQVKLWRRSYNVAPPGGESLRDVCRRTTPFYKKYIEKDLKEGKNILIVASHNSLRAIAKYIENISDEKIIELELPFGSLVKYDFDGEKYKKI